MADPQTEAKGLLGRWLAIPLYLRIVLAMIVGLFTGLLLGDHALIFEIPSTVILQLLGALAPPLILIAVTHVLMTSEITGKSAGRLAGLLLLNTTVAIAIGLSIANIMEPGKWGDAKSPVAVAEEETDGGPSSAKPFDVFLKNVPKSLLGPLGDQQNIIGVICIAGAFGVALRGVKENRIDNVQHFVEVAYAWVTSSSVACWTGGPNSIRCPQLPQRKRETAWAPPEGWPSLKEYLLSRGSW